MMRPPIQLDLFDQPTLNVSKSVKMAMSEDVRLSGMSREQVIERMNDLAERHGVCLTHGNSQKLTIDTFEKWLNVQDARHIPVKALPVFCAAVGRSSSMDALVRPIGLRVIGDREQKMLAWAEAKMEVQRKSRQIRKIEAEL